MAEDSGQTRGDHEKVRRAEHQPVQTGMGLDGLPAPGLDTPAYSTSLLGDPRLSGRGNEPVRIALMRQMQQTYGNRAVQRWIAAQRSIQPAMGAARAKAANGEEDIGKGEEPVQRRIPSPTTPSTSAVRPEQLARFRELVAQYQALLGSNTLTPEEVAEVNQAISRAQNAVRQSEEVSGRGQSLRSAAGVTLGVAGVLAADDVTGVGVADDVVLPFVLLAAGALALGAWATSSPTRDIERTGQAARDAVEEAIETMGQILMAQQVGNQVRGLTTQVVIHLARILGTTVGGQPPDHQNDPDRDRPHWWTEIKNFIQQIRSKGLSPRQLLRELRREFSDAQLSEIREALRQAARRMGEDPPDFPPMASP